MPAPDAGFTVTFATPKFQPATVPVQVHRNPGDFATPASTTIDPNPVVAELQPAGPPPEPPRKPMRPKKPKAALRRPRPRTPPFPDAGSGCRRRRQPADWLALHTVRIARL